MTNFVILEAVIQEYSEEVLPAVVTPDPLTFKSS